MSPIACRTPALCAVNVAVESLNLAPMPSLADDTKRRLPPPAARGSSSSSASGGDAVAKVNQRLRLTLTSITSALRARELFVEVKHELSGRILYVPIRSSADASSLAPSRPYAAVAANFSPDALLSSTHGDVFGSSKPTDGGGEDEISFATFAPAPFALADEKDAITLELVRHRIGHFRASLSAPQCMDLIQIYRTAAAERSAAAAAQATNPNNNTNCGGGALATQQDSAVFTMIYLNFGLPRGNSDVPAAVAALRFHWPLIERHQDAVSRGVAASAAMPTAPSVRLCRPAGVVGAAPSTTAASPAAFSWATCIDVFIRCRMRTSSVPNPPRPLRR